MNHNEMKIEYRGLIKEDYPIICKLIEEQSGYGRFCDKDKTKELLSKLSFYTYLREADYIQVAALRKKTIAVLMGDRDGRKKGLPIGLFFKKLWTSLRLHLSKDGRAAMKMLEQFNEQGRVLCDQSKPEGIRILFFSVAKKYRRQGIGYQLWFRLCDAMDNQNSHGSYLITEQNSNNYFFELQGFQRKAAVTEMIEPKSQRFRMQLNLYVLPAHESC